MAPNVAEISRALIALCASVALFGCSDHRVSPWGTAGGPRLSMYVEPPDLDDKLAEIDAETKAIGLKQTVELRGKLARGAGGVVVRAYEGTDALGRKTTAVRAASPRGVILAVGPLDARDTVRTQATELVPTLGVSHPSLRSVGDLNGDGTPDVVLRNEAGALWIWSLEPLGARAYDVRIETPAAQLLDADGDGRLDFGGRVPLDEGDPIAPSLDDVATFDGVRYDDAAPGARAYHARRLALLEPKKERPKDVKASPKDDKGSPNDDKASRKDDADPPSVRLRRALERAWHAILSGRPKDKALAELSAESIPAAFRSAFDAHRRRIEGLRPR